VKASPIEAFGYSLRVRLVVVDNEDLCHYIRGSRGMIGRWARRCRIHKYDLIRTVGIGPDPLERANWEAVYCRRSGDKIN
jgi:hypothetical protein